MKSSGNRLGVFGQVSLCMLKVFCIRIYSFLAIIGLQGFFPLKGQAAVGVGSIEFPTAERKRLANL